MLEELLDWLGLLLALLEELLEQSSSLLQSSVELLDFLSAELLDE